MFKNLKKVIKAEIGQALPITLALLIIGGLTIVPSLNLTFSSAKSSRMLEANIKGTYAADAGVEYALWSLANGMSPPSQLAENINDMQVNIQTVEKGTYTVYPGAVLGGSGEIGAMVNIINALLSPGMSIGTLTIVGDTTLDGGELYIEVADTRPGNESFDQLVIEGGTLDLINGASLTVATPLDALKMHVGAEITIVDIVAGGNVSGEFDGLPDGTEFTDENGVYRWQISYGGSPDHDITLRLTYIPEPASILLLGLGSLLVARRRRRR